VRWGVEPKHQKAAISLPRAETPGDGRANSSPVWWGSAVAAAALARRSSALAHPNAHVTSSVPKHAFSLADRPEKVSSLSKRPALAWGRRGRRTRLSRESPPAPNTSERVPLCVRATAAGTKPRHQEELFPPGGNQPAGRRKGQALARSSTCTAHAPGAMPVARNKQHPESAGEIPPRYVQMLSGNVQSEETAMRAARSSWFQGGRAAGGNTGWCRNRP